MTTNEEEVKLCYPLFLMGINSFGELRRFAYLDYRGNPMFGRKDMLLDRQLIQEVQIEEAKMEDDASGNINNDKITENSL